MPVVQAAMIYGSDIWVTKPRIRRVLGGLHHRVARRLTGRQPRIEWDSGWVYPFAGIRDGEGGINRGGDLRILPPEHSCTVYCKRSHYGPMSRGGAEDGVKGGQSVVGVGRIELGGDVDGGLV